jgi:hypothetical protein
VSCCRKGEREKGLGDNPRAVIWGTFRVKQPPTDPKRTTVIGTSLGQAFEEGVRFLLSILTLDPSLTMGKPKALLLGRLDQ